MASAAPLTVTYGVTVWNPSGTGLTFSTMPLPLYAHLTRRECTPRPSGSHPRMPAEVLPRKQALPHQELVRLTGGLAALGYGPDYERGAPLGVAGDKEVLLFRAEPVLRADRAAVGVAEVEVLLETVLHGAGEADGEQDEVGVDLELRTLLRDRLALRRPLRLDGVHLLDVAVRAREAPDGDGEVALPALLMCRVCVEDQGPVGPGEVVGVLGRLRAMGEDLDRGAALAVGVAQAVGARVAAAEDDDVLALGTDLDLGVGRQPR